MDEVDIFEDALFTVFAHHQPARGDPGSVAHYPHAALPGWVGAVSYTHLTLPTNREV